MIPYLNISYDKTLAISQAEQLSKLINSRASLSEAKHLDPFFVKNYQVLATIAAGMEDGTPDRFYSHPPIKNGQYYSDFAYLNSKSGRLLLVEIEDAKKYSIFQKTPPGNPKWSRRFEVGYSQVIDWLYQFHDMPEKDQRHDFDCKINHVDGLLIIGKDDHLNDSQKHRLKWRWENVEVQGNRRIKVYTFDALAKKVITTIELHTKIWGGS